MYDDNNKKSNIKAIMFDLDDTIFDSKKAQYNAICEFKNSFQEFEKMEDSEFAKLWNEITSQCRINSF